MKETAMRVADAGKAGVMDHDVELPADFEVIVCPDEAFMDAWKRRGRRGLILAVGVSVGGVVLARVTGAGGMGDMPWWQMLLMCVMIGAAYAGVDRYMTFRMRQEFIRVTPAMVSMHGMRGVNDIEVHDGIAISRGKRKWRLTNAAGGAMSVLVGQYPGLEADLRQLGVLRYE